MKVTMVLEGMPQLLSNTQRLRTTLTRQANTSAWNGAQHLYARTRAVVPYLTGELYDAAYIANISPNEKNRVWVVGYDTVAVEHAIIVHETPNRNHPTRDPSNEPKQDHYLSEPRDAMVASFPRTVADEMRDAIRSARIRA